MLVLADRNFYSYQAWQQARATGAALLWRVSAGLRLPVLEWLPDGSYRSVLINPKVRGRRREQLLAAAAAGAELDPAQAMGVRAVEYMIDNRAGGGELFCLITTIGDHDFAAAVELAAAYAQRWEIELSFDEIEIHQTGGERVLRSRTPELVKQEDMVAAAHALRDTPRHERRRRHRRDRPRRPIIHTQLPRDPPPGSQPGGLFPLTDSPTPSPKPPPRSSNNASAHGDNEPVPGWSRDTGRTATASNEKPTESNSTPTPGDPHLQDRVPNLAALGSTSNRRWDSRRGRGHSAEVRVCAAGLRRSSWPKCNLVEWGIS